MIPKAVVFDLGKVLLDFDFALAANRLQPLCSVSLRDLQTSIDQSPLLFQFETGRIRVDEFFEAVRSMTGFGGDLEEFSEAFADIFSPMDSMIGIHEHLRQQGIPTFVFSNTNELAVRHIQQRFSFFADFDGYVFSHQHGVMKPDSALYEVVESLSALSGSDLCFIDDRKENVDAALERGWRAVVHESTDKTSAFLRETGLLNEMKPRFGSVVRRESDSR